MPSYIRFDYLNDEEFESNSFVEYLGQIYDISEFVLIENNSDFKGWDGYSSDSYFSGTLIKICKDNDFVIMGRYYC